ncbi:acriflavine resistance protein B [Acinetobacter sp. GN11]
MSKFFIYRPKFAWVVAIFILLAGLLAIPNLPVAQFPNVAPPQILITANYPGASAQTITDTVTTVIEEELASAKNLLYFSSNNSNNVVEITVTFEPGTDPDLAQVDVQNRLKNAESRLPDSVRQLGLVVEQANAGFLMFYGLTFKDDALSQNTVELADYAVRNINNEIRRIPGVGKLQFYSSDPSMRVWLDPQKMVGYGISIDQVNQAIRDQNVQIPGGAFGARPIDVGQELTASLLIQGMKRDPKEFGDIIVRSNRDGSTVHLSDIARTEVDLQSFAYESRIGGRPAVTGAIQLSPGANSLETSAAIKAKMEELSKAFPEHINYVLAYDTSLFVKVAMKKVVLTLVEAVVLVFLVMLLFLQNFRYTLVPTIVVPICLLGTFAVMYVIGFSINMMTMFGMVLAIGILVDDAIVVVENVERIMAEEGLSPVDATVKAMSQVGGAIVGITLVLAAVFLPLAFMSGSVGIIYKQFALTLAVSILFSGFLALTLTPALCATLLKPISKGHHHEKKGFFGWFNRNLARLTERFDLLNQKLIKRAGRGMLVYAALIVLLFVTYGRVPEAFVPQEDQGYNLVDILLPPGATYTRSEKLTAEVEQYLAGRDAIDEVISLVGWSYSGTGENTATIFPSFKHWSERSSDQSVDKETDLLNNAFALNKTGRVLGINPPPIEGLGNAGGFALRLQDRGGIGYEALSKAKDELLEKAANSPKIAYAMVEGLPDAPQLVVTIDRSKAEAMGVRFDSIRNTVATAFGSEVVGDYINNGRLQRVVVQSQGARRTNPKEILELNVANEDGELVPLSSFASVGWQSGPSQVTRYNGYLAFSINGDAAQGYTSGEAMTEIEMLVSQLPRGIGYEWTGLSYQQIQAGSQVPILLSLSILAVFLLLVALYESWSIPLSVMLIVPIGALGSVLAIMLVNLIPSSTTIANDVYFKVGLVTIIGLSAKNAILIIEFAKTMLTDGITLDEAATEAARLRFRPIIMTSMAFILGVVPLLVATGAGGASQRSLGTGVFGGMITATILGVLFVPIFFKFVMRLVAKLSKVNHNP